MVSPARMCLYCKGSRNLCGWRVCPLYSRNREIPKIKKSLKKDFFGPSTSVFVGHNFYPNVYVGPLASLDSENTEIIDSPEKWFGKPYGEIIRFRSLVLRSKAKENIFSKSKFIEQNQELALANNPTDVEMFFNKTPKIAFETSDIVKPMGPSGTLKKLKIVENPKISQKVEYIVRDEIKANTAGNLLYKKGVDVHKISTILSSGILGKNENKKLVPTRWGITATDSMIADNMLKKVKDFPSVNEFIVFESEYLDNHFVVLLMPGNWEFDNFEAWAPGSTWSFDLKKTEIIEEHEPNRGRTKYADKQAGGFYASRFAIIEFLHKIKRQARVVAFREISEGYTISLGVWVVRDTCRHAFRNKPVKFDTLDSALTYVDSKIKLPLKDYRSKSVMLRQRKLENFFSKIN
ncbi:MAG: hypothetical protein KAS04_00365 [Candidatus Aenigmarchaeota archaeon]|nr:hypothetical protein [Candidatus Aenigmarchaeota archaeon]